MATLQPLSSAPYNVLSLLKKRKINKDFLISDCIILKNYFEYDTVFASMLKDIVCEYTEEKYDTIKSYERDIPENFKKHDWKNFNGIEELKKYFYDNKLLKEKQFKKKLLKEQNRFKKNELRRKADISEDKKTFRTQGITWESDDVFISEEYYDSDSDSDSDDEDKIVLVSCSPKTINSTGPSPRTKRISPGIEFLGNFDKIELKQLYKKIPKKHKGSFRIDEKNNKIVSDIRNIRLLETHIKERKEIIKEAIDKLKKFEAKF